MGRRRYRLLRVDADAADARTGPPAEGNNSSAPDLQSPLAQPDLRQLTHFVAAVEQGGFSRAAAQLHVSQQAVSASVAQLERRLGARLMIRTTRRVVGLTPAGQRLLDGAREVLDLLERTVADVRRLGVAHMPPLRLGFVGNAAAELTPLIARGFTRTLPHVELQLRTFDFEHPSAGLLTGESDVALLRLPVHHPGIGSRVLFTEPRVFVLPADHRLARQATIASGELADEPVVFHGRDASEDPTAAAWRAFFTPRASTERTAPTGVAARTVEEYFEAIAGGMGIGVSPASAARFHSRPGVAFVPAADLDPSVVVVAWPRRRRHPATDAFVDVAMTAAAALVEDSELVGTV